MLQNRNKICNVLTYLLQSYGQMTLKYFAMVQKNHMTSGNIHFALFFDTNNNSVPSARPPVIHNNEKELKVPVIFIPSENRLIDVHVTMYLGPRDF